MEKIIIRQIAKILLTVLIVIINITFINPVILAEAEVINIIPSRQEIFDIVKCSCVKGVRSFGVSIPFGTDAVDIKPNTTIAIGTIAIFKYRTTHHIAFVNSIEEKGFWIKETNFKKCEYGERFIYWEDQYLIGFNDIISLTNNNMEELENGVVEEITEEVDTGEVVDEVDTEDEE